MVDVGCRLTNDFEEFSHKAEAVYSGVGKSGDTNGGLGLISSEYQVV